MHLSSGNENLFTFYSICNFNSIHFAVFFCWKNYPTGPTLFFFSQWWFRADDSLQSKPHALLFIKLIVIHNIDYDIKLTFFLGLPKKKGGGKSFYKSQKVFHLIRIFFSFLFKKIPRFFLTSKCTKVVPPLIRWGVVRPPPALPIEPWSRFHVLFLRSGLAKKTRGYQNDSESNCLPPLLLFPIFFQFPAKRCKIPTP